MVEVQLSIEKDKNKKLLQNFKTFEDWKQAINGKNKLTECHIIFYLEFNRENVNVQQCIGGEVEGNQK